MEAVEPIPPARATAGIMRADGDAGPSRRTVIRGLAWSAPTIAVAAAVPQAAASVAVDITLIAVSPDYLFLDQAHTLTLTVSGNDGSWTGYRVRFTPLAPVVPVPVEFDATFTSLTEVTLNLPSDGLSAYGFNDVTLLVMKGGQWYTAPGTVSVLVNPV